jgi:hypothetical protein
MKKLVILFVALISGFAGAEQVLLSCDLLGIEGVGTVNILRSEAGLQVALVMSDSAKTVYSLPLDSQAVPATIDLGQFNIFNDTVNPELYSVNGSWVYTEDGSAPRNISCVELHSSAF